MPEATVTPADAAIPTLAAVLDPATASGDARYYAELGVPRGFRLRDWPASEKPLRFSPDNYEYLVPHLEQHTSVGHSFPGGPSGEGSWAIDIWTRGLANTPLSPTARETLLRWHASGATRRFASDQQAMRALDTMSYQDFLERELHLGPEAARYADLFLASAVGLGSDAVSAYAAYQLPMPALTDPLPPDLRRVSFPGGNSGLIRYFLKRLIPGAIAGTDRFEDVITGRINLMALDRPEQPLRMRLRSTAVSVEHQADRTSPGTVRVVYTRDGRLHGVRARAVIMATGGWMNLHVVRDLPESHRAAYRQFVHAPYLVANVALNNWRFLEKLGITAAIWERDDEGFGFTCNIRNPMQVGDYQPPLHPDQPAILTFYTPFHLSPIEAPNSVGRAVLFDDDPVFPTRGPVCDVVTIAKRDLKAGEILDGIGGYLSFGGIDNTSVAIRDNLLPMGLSEGCVLKRDLPMDAGITFADVEMPKGRVSDRLWAEQVEHFGLRKNKKIA